MKEDFSEEAIRSLYNIAGKDAVKLAKWLKKVGQNISVELINAIVKNQTKEQKQLTLDETKETKNENSTEPQTGA